MSGEGQIRNNTYGHINHSRWKETGLVTNLEKSKQGLDLLSKSLEPLNRIVVIPRRGRELKSFWGIYKRAYRGVIP